MSANPYKESWVYDYIRKWQWTRSKHWVEPGGITFTRLYLAWGYDGEVARCIIDISGDYLHIFGDIIFQIQGGFQQHIKSNQISLFPEMVDVMIAQRANQRWHPVRRITKSSWKIHIDLNRDNWLLWWKYSCY